MPAVLITGASRGLGFELAKQYAVEGWRVIACCRKPEDAIALKKLAPSARDMVSVVAMDVADNDTVRNAALTLKDVVVDILINSAGIAGVPQQSTGKIDYASWARVLDVNTSGGSIAYRSSKAAVNMVMRSAAIDLATRGITCVLINPGWVKTDMGGPHATLSPRQSVSAMRRLIERLGPHDSGKFYNYDGREYPW